MSAQGLHNSDGKESFATQQHILKDLVQAVQSFDLDAFAQNIQTCEEPRTLEESIQLTYGLTKAFELFSSKIVEAGAKISTRLDEVQRQRTAAAKRKHEPSLDDVVELRVSGGSTEELALWIDGVYVLNGEHDGKPAFTKKDPDTGQPSVRVYFVRASEAFVSAWWIGDANDTEMVYLDNRSDEPLPPHTGWGCQDEDEVFIPDESLRIDYKYRTENEKQKQQVRVTQQEAPKAEAKRMPKAKAEQKEADVVVSGCQDATLSPYIKGRYYLDGENHGKKKYKRKKMPENEDVFLYYWNRPGEVDFFGWWFGGEVGGDENYAQHSNAKEHTSEHPPATGWMVGGKPDVTIRVQVKAAADAKPTPTASPKLIPRASPKPTITSPKHPPASPKATPKLAPKPPIASSAPSSKAGKADPIASKPSESDHYAVLGVSEDATVDQIKKAFLLKSKQYHPDKNAGDETCKANFQLVNEAKQVLIDDSKRLQYDAERFVRSCRLAPDHDQYDSAVAVAQRHLAAKESGRVLRKKDIDPTHIEMFIAGDGKLLKAMKMTSGAEFRVLPSACIVLAGTEDQVRSGLKLIEDQTDNFDN